ncbi:MAG: NAD-dependent dehydratase [Rhodocyclales bacterium]|nr:NAD-dependent dehydratase [Rhodocyclales bacterium]
MFRIQVGKKQKQDMTLRSVLLVGGTGFIGSSVAQRLSALGLHVIVPTRRLTKGDALRMLPTIDLVEADIYDTCALCGLMNEVDAVVNLVGVLHSESDAPYGPEFARAHVELPRTLVAAARLSEVPRIVHVSALGADIHGPSEYLRSKADGEAVIRATGPEIAWSIFRPAVVFGPHDKFLNLFATLTAHLPVLPLGGAHTRFQPVFVEDVAAAIVHAVLHRAGLGETIELAGPRIYTLAELVSYVAQLQDHHCMILPLSEKLALLQAAIMECLPGPLMSRDNVRSMRRDCVASTSVAGTTASMPFGIHATALETVAPQWLCDDGDWRGMFNGFRQRAHRRNL